MFKDVENPKQDEMLRFAVVVVSLIFVTVAIAASYEITQWI